MMMLAEESAKLPRSRWTATRICQMQGGDTGGRVIEAARIEMDGNENMPDARW
jgi:hypothetical protein